ncbi:flagellar hook-basal body complex protein FliE [Pluralibacter gergoviae]
MAVTGIESALLQMQSLTSAARGPQAEAAPAVSFSGQLTAALDRISETQLGAKAQAEKFAIGEPGVGLNDVMTDLQKSTISLQMGIQVRNKLVAAYQDIMNMSV